MGEFQMSSLEISRIFTHLVNFDNEILTEKNKLKPFTTSLENATILHQEHFCTLIGKYYYQIVGQVHKITWFSCPPMW